MIELFKDLSSLVRLNLESNRILMINKYALVNLSNLERVCLFDNPLSIYYPISLAGICNTNSKCNVFVTSKCSDSK